MSLMSEPAHFPYKGGGLFKKIRLPKRAIIVCPGVTTEWKLTVVELKTKAWGDFESETKPDL